VPVDEGLAELSDTLLLVAVLCYAVAMIGYAAELAFGRRPREQALTVIAGGATDTMPASWTPTAIPERSQLSGRGAAVGKGAVVVTVVGWLVHVASLTTRGLAVERVPWGNMYEFSSAVCLAAVTGFLYLLTRQPVRHLGAVVMLPVVIYLGIAGTLLYAPASPLVPALNSYWLKIHVAAAAIATGVFMIGFTTTLLYLVQDFRERRRPAGAPVETIGGVAVGRRSRLPSAASLDAVAYRVTAFAFPLWTFAVIAGAVWAEAAWGGTGAGTRRRRGPSSPGCSTPATFTHVHCLAGRALVRPGLRCSPSSR